MFLIIAPYISIKINFYSYFYKLEFFPLVDKTNNYIILGIISMNINIHIYIYINI